MEKSENSISRRSFLTAAAATGALAAVAGVAGCSSTSSSSAQTASTSSTETVPEWLGTAPKITDADCTETVDCEVLVVGAGVGGYFAAAGAAESGAKTLLIEKMSVGNSIRSSALGAANSKLQQAQGITIDRQDMINDMDHYANGHVNTKLYYKWFDNSGEAIDWYTDLMAKNGVTVQLEWNMPEGTRYKEWPTGHGTNGDDYTTREQLTAQIMDTYITSFSNAEERFSTPMQELIMENGKCVGVYAKDKESGDYLRINASKGVIIATGGYAGNQDMYKALQPTRYSCLGTFDCFPTCTGDGIKALLWAGATMDDVPTSLTFNRCLLTADQEPGDPYNVNEDQYGYFFYSSQPFLRVDYTGNRFHNESAPYDYVLSAMAKEPEGKRYWHQVWDSNWKEDIYRFHTVGCSTITYREGADHDAFPTMIDDYIEPQMMSFVDAGFIVQADTLDDLATKMGFTGEEKQNFLDTCARQNANYDAQVDDDFGKEAFRLSALRTPPYYGTVKSCGLTLCTFDGIQVNDDLQPYATDGSVIEGVYVVGNDQGSYYNGMYPNLAAGFNAGRCATFGRMVAKALATSK